VVVALVLVLALVVLAAWWVLRSVPDPDEVELTSTRRSPATVTSASSAARRADRPADRSADPGDSTAAGASPRPATPGEAAIVVDVAGKVRRPGIVELPAGSRVVDAIEAAGGLRHGVDPATVNQARLLSDGEQLVVGLDPQPPVGAPPTSSTPEQPEPAPVNLNAATQTELEALPGIGPVTAAAILAWRDEHGRFSRIDELLEVSGIGDVTFSEISPFVYV